MSRGRSKLIARSSMMRPGRGLITQMRFERNSASRRSWVTSSTVARVSIHRVLEREPPFLAGEVVERAERFVEQKQIGLVDQCATQVGALHHAAGQLPGVLVGEVDQPDLLQQCIDPVAILAGPLGAKVALEGRDDLQRQHHVAADRQSGQQRGALEGRADPHRPDADLASRDEDLTGAGAQRR